MKSDSRTWSINFTFSICLSHGLLWLSVILLSSHPTGDGLNRKSGIIITYADRKIHYISAVVFLCQMSTLRRAWLGYWDDRNHLAMSLPPVQALQWSMRAGKRRAWPRQAENSHENSVIVKISNLKIQSKKKKSWLNASFNEQTLWTTSGLLGARMYASKQNRPSSVAFNECALRERRNPDFYKTRMSTTEHNRNNTSFMITRIHRDSNSKP